MESVSALSYLIWGENMDLKNRVQKMKLDRISKSNQTLKDMNKRLVEENNSLKEKISSLEKTILEIQDLGEEYHLLQ